MANPKFIGVIDAENQPHLINVELIIDVIELSNNGGGKIILTPNVTIYLSPAEFTNVKVKLSHYDL
jgi:hypothetical protein